VCYVGDQSTLRVLKDNAVPHIFAWSRAEAVASQNRRRSTAKRKARERRQQTAADEACLNVSNEVIIDQPVDVPCITRLDVSPVPTVVSHATQTVQRNMQLLSAKLLPPNRGLCITTLVLRHTTNLSWFWILLAEMHIT